MKAILCILMASFGMTYLADAQTALPTAGPSFSSKDTTKADVISVASMQSYPIAIDRESTVVEDSIPAPEEEVIIYSRSIVLEDSIQTSETVIESKSIVLEDSTQTQQTITTKPASSDGPIRAWSNPPGYMGSQKKVTMTKHKPLGTFKRTDAKKGKSKKGCPAG